METVCSCTSRVTNIATSQEGGKLNAVEKKILVIECTLCSSKDYTSTFGGTPYEGSFTPQIHDTFNRYSVSPSRMGYYSFIHCFCVCIRKVKSCILDGEMVGWDPESESFL